MCEERQKQDKISVCCESHDKQSPQKYESDSFKIGEYYKEQYNDQIGMKI